MQKLITCVALATLFLTGCTPETLRSSAANASASMKGGFASLTNSVKNLSFLPGNNLKPEVSVWQSTIDQFEGNAGQLSVNADIGDLRAGDRLQAKVPGLEAYANRVLDNLLAAWPGEPLEAEVKLLRSPMYKAEVGKSNTIFLALGVFSSGPQSEDELAALIAHELGHIVGDHQQTNAFTGALGKLQSVRQLTLDRKIERASISENQYDDKSKQAELQGWAATQLAMPNWSRGQETEADAFGIELMARAGYNPGAMKTVIDNLEAASLSSRSMTERQLDSLSKSFSVSNAGKIDFDRDIALGGVKTLLEESVGKAYETGGKRQQFARTYAKTHHPERIANTPSSVPKILKQGVVKTRLSQYQDSFDADAALQEGQLQKAYDLATKVLKTRDSSDPLARRVLSLTLLVKNKDIKPYIEQNMAAIRSGEAIYSQFQAGILYQLNEGDAKGALAVAEQGYAEMNEPAKLLPLLIALNSANGNVATDYMATCMRSLEPEVMAQCSSMAR